MPEFLRLTYADVRIQADRVAERWRDKSIASVYGVPRGGVAPAMMVAARLGVPIVDEPKPSTLVVDDIIDSGATWRRYHARGLAFDAVYCTMSGRSVGHNMDPFVVPADTWVVFPWEGETDQAGPGDVVVRLLEYLGENPNRPGLVDTPRRVLDSLAEMTNGYRADPAEHLGVVFPDTCDEMVVVTGIDFTSLCEHHLLTFSGTATVAYIPDGQVVGLSKLARVVDVFAHRLQVQERLTEQIAEAIETHLQPAGVGVVIEATHSCMTCRGVRKPGATMVTSALRGAIKDKAAARAEFLTLARH